jgi:gluconate 2-dehydrogenase gamma chain
MDRRNSIKALLVGSMATGVLVEACKPSEKKAIAASADATLDMDRMQEEKDAF